MPAIKPHCVAEDGGEIVDSSGRVVSTFGVADPDKGEFGFTQEHEIMRGDLVKVLYDASLELRKRLDAEGRGRGGSLKYEFGKSITALTQVEGGAEATFSCGERRRFDLVVGADGQNSRTRRLAFGQEVSDQSLSPWGIYVAYASIPKIKNEKEGFAQGYCAGSGRWVLTRSVGLPTTHFGLITKSGANTERLRSVNWASMDEQKQVFREIFKGAGWKTDELLGALDSCDDFYMSEILQVKMKESYKGRVALIGDAGYCPSAFTGMGTTLSFSGAYVLAGELARHEGDVDAALAGYEKVIRPAIDEYQRPFPQIVLRILFPDSRLGVWVLHWFFWLVSSLSFPWIANLIKWLAPKKGDRWNAPVYPELNLPS